MSSTSQPTINRPWILALAVIIALIFIGGGFLLGQNNAQRPAENPSSYLPVALTDTDHVLGNPETATITIIEYSDIECPFCKQFHATTQALFAAYEEDVALVFRHLPLDGLHQNARTEAEATECVNELAGNETFWNYLNTLYERTESNDGLDLALLPDIAEEVGVERAAFVSCLESNRHGETVAAQEALAAPFNVRGTPYSIFLLSDGTYYTVPGAYPGDLLAVTIEAVLGGAPAEKNQTFIDMYTQVLQGLIDPEEFTAYFEEQLKPYLPDNTSEEAAE